MQNSIWTSGAVARRHLFACAWGRRFLALLAVCGLGWALLPAAQGRILEFGVDPANLGKGDWIYFISDATNRLGGNVSSVTNIPSLMKYYKSVGFKFFIVKAGTGGTQFNGSGSTPQFNSNLVAAAHAEGLKIFGYTRSDGRDVPGEINLARIVYNLGADGFVLDAEAEWESLSDAGARAIQLCSAIKSEFPNKFLGHSPLPIISFHTAFPYKEFGFYCDNTMPQDYWQDGGLGTLVNFSPTTMVKRMDTEYGNWQNSLTGIWTNAIKPLAPVGGAWTSTSHPDKPVTGAQVLEFVNALKNDTNAVTVGGYKGVSFWRTDLHTADIWAGIAAATIGDNFVGPTITTPPAPATANAGGSASFSVAADGTPTLFYQWRFNGTNLPAATLSVLGLNNVQATNAGGYSVVVSNNYGMVTSVVAALTVISPPFITQHPLDQTSATGSNALFTVRVAGTPPFFFRWRKEATNLVDGGSIIGSTTSNLLITNLVVEDAGIYSVLVSNSVGTALSSNAVLTVATVPPYVVVQPKSITNNAGTMATLSLQANGTTPLLYQWKKGAANVLNVATNITGATTSTLVISNVFRVDQGSYSVALTNDYGTTNSLAANLVVIDPAFNGQPVSVVTNATAPVTFSAKPAGSAPLFLFWQRNGVTIGNGGTVTGATTANLTINGVLKADTGNYTLIASNSFGSVTSTVANLFIFDPVITAQPQNRTNAAGSNATFSVTAVGTQEIFYRWRSNNFVLNNNSHLSGVDTATLTISNVSSADVANYSVSVFSTASNITSTAASLTVLNPPTLTNQPASATLDEGTNIILTVGATGTGPFYYQWKKNGQNVPFNGNGAAYAIFNAQAADAGTYTVEVSNVVAAVTSSNALINVLLPFRIDNVTATPQFNRAIIRWNTTSNATGQVEFGLTTNYGSFSALSSVPATNHALLIDHLLPDTNYFFRVRSRIGVNELTGGDGGFYTEMAIIMDNESAALAGTWTLGAGTLDKYGDSYNYTSTTAGGTTASATFVPQLPEGGHYDVAEWHTAGATKTAHAQVLVFGREESPGFVIDQTVNGGQWLTLVTNVDFVGDASDYVRFINSTGEEGKTLVADAVRWTFNPHFDNHRSNSLPAWWTSFYFGTNAPAATEDTDSDGSSNFQEYVMGTIPDEGSSRLVFQTTAPTNQVLEAVITPFIAGRAYALEVSTSLPGGWVPANAVVQPQTNGTARVSIAVPAGSEHYYRLSVHLE